MKENLDSLKKDFVSVMKCDIPSMYEFKHEYIRRVRPFKLLSYVKGKVGGLNVSGYVEAYQVDDEGNLSMIIITKEKGLEHAIYIDKEVIKTFELMNY